MKLFTKKEFVLFFLIFLLGAFLRLYHLDYPLGLHGDEAWPGIEANRILQSGSIGIWSLGAFGQPTLPFYWTALIFKFFGSNLLTLRLSFALITIITLPFFYFIVRLFFGKTVGLIAFFLYVTARIPIHFSHIAQNAYMVPFLPTVFFFLITLKKNSIQYALACGFFLGICFYVYVGLKILPVLFILFVIFKSFQKNFLKTFWKKIIIISLFSFIIFLPLGIYAYENPDLFMSRLNFINIFSQESLIHEESVVGHKVSSIEILGDNIKSIALMFNFRGDGDPQDNQSNLPLFDVISGLFFALGFIDSLFRFKDGRRIFILLWFFIFLAGSLFTIDAPNFRRVQPAIAASYIFVALGVKYLYMTIKKIIPKRVMHLKYIFILVLIFIGIYNIQLYFTNQAISQETKSTYAYPLVKVADYLNTFHQPLYVYFYSDRWPYHYETLRFLLSDVPGEDRSAQFGNFSLINTSKSKNVVYIFLPEYISQLTELSQLYPNGKTHIAKDTDGTLLFGAYFLQDVKQSF